MDDRVFMPTNRRIIQCRVQYNDVVCRRRRRPHFLSRNRMNQDTATLIFLMFAVAYAVEGKLLSAYEQAYGQWNIRLKKNIFANRRWYLERASNTSTSKKNQRNGCKEENDLQLLFPTIVIQHLTDDASDESESANESIQLSSMQRKNAPNEISTNYDKTPSEFQITKQPVNTVSCILNLEKNGKFTMSILSHDKADNSNNSLSRNQNIQRHFSVNHLPLQGEWYLTPNPYCVTDRQYDTITLISQPRMRRIAKTSQNSKIFMIEKATVEIRCRLWGRYGGGSIRKLIGLGHGRRMGRMTHGIVMIVREFVVDGAVGDTARQLPKREIVGTFRGRACIELDSPLVKQEDDGFCDYGHVENEDRDSYDGFGFGDFDEDFE